MARLFSVKVEGTEKGTGYRRISRNERSYDPELARNEEFQGCFGWLYVFSQPFSAPREMGLFIQGKRKETGVWLLERDS